MHLDGMKKNCCRIVTDVKELKNSSVLCWIQQFNSFSRHQWQRCKAEAGLFTSGSESKNGFYACAVLYVVKTVCRYVGLFVTMFFNCLL